MEAVLDQGNARAQRRSSRDHETVPLETYFTEDASEALGACGPYLTSRPVEHNVLLTVLRRRIAEPTAGRYWWILDQGAVVGIVMQSPLSFHGAVTPMTTLAAQTLVRVVSEEAPELPGIAGEAATAASFAGRWAEQLRIPATPVEGRVNRSTNCRTRTRARAAAEVMR
jgi:hypothetical protein